VNRNSDKARLLRAVAAIDSGTAFNPDGIRNQTEGGIIQSASWTLLEQVRFDTTRITSRDWSTYPIMRMRYVPETVEVAIIDRPGAPYLGTGDRSRAHGCGDRQRGHGCDRAAHSPHPSHGGPDQGGHRRVD
jgi:nicotinate dehydrogenase subunit B